MSKIPPRSEQIWDVDYTGPRWTYGLTWRSIRNGGVPDGFIIYSHRAANAPFRFGVVDYPRPLTDEEIEAYHLTLIED